jgi:predicted  nucleic acid-binding Zn-ribbon protein
MDGVTRTVGNAASAVRNLVGGSGDNSAGPAEHSTGESTSATSDDIIEADDYPGVDKRAADRPPVPDPRPISARVKRERETADDENQAPTAAEDQSPTVAEEQAPTAEVDADSDGRTADFIDPQGEADDSVPISADDPTDRPSLADLRAELNDQFESIRVVAPGQYELNLMELYDREEYIIALQEDGKYTIQLPERWEESTSSEQ